MYKLYIVSSSEQANRREIKANIIMVALKNYNNQEKTTDKSFAWSIKPLIIFCLLFGIRLDVTQRRPAGSLQLIMIIIFGLAWLVLNLFFNGVTFWKTFVKNNYIIEKATLTNSGRYQDTISNINSIIGIFINTLLPIGSHVIFAIALQHQWHNLWENLLEIQSEFKLENTFFKKCRRHCWVFLLFLFAVY